MKTKLLATVALAVLVSACAPKPGSPEARLEALQQAQEAKVESTDTQIANIPDWFIEPPVNDHAVYAVGSGGSTSLDMSLTKATLSAKRGLADRINGELSEKIKEFATEVGNVNDPVTVEEVERATVNIINGTAVYGYAVANKSIQNVNGRFYSYILLEYADAEINKVLRLQLERERNATVDARKIQIFSELEAAIKAKSAPVKPVTSAPLAE